MIARDDDDPMTRGLWLLHFLELRQVRVHLVGTRMMIHNRCKATSEQLVELKELRAEVRSILMQQAKDAKEATTEAQHVTRAGLRDHRRRGKTWDQVEPEEPDQVAVPVDGSAADTREPDPEPIPFPSLAFVGFASAAGPLSRRRFHFTLEQSTRGPRQWEIEARGRKARRELMRAEVARLERVLEDHHHLSAEETTNV